MHLKNSNNTMKTYKKSTILFILILLLIYSCNPFSKTRSKEIEINGTKLYILSKEWGIGGGGHY